MTINEKMWEWIVKTAYEEKMVVGHNGEYTDYEMLTVCDSNMNMAVWIFDREIDKITFEGLE